MLSGLINAKGIMDDDSMKDVRVAAVMPGLWGVCMGGEEGGGNRVEGPGKAGVRTACKLMWLRC